VLSGTTQGHLLRWNLDDYQEQEEDDSMTLMLEADVVANLDEMIINVIYRDHVILCIKCE
jgi:hypothetical protein